MTRPARFRLVPRLAVLGACLVAACGQTAPQAGTQAPPAFDTPQVTYDAQGRCFGRDVTPAVLQTVTVQVPDQPAVTAPDGTVIHPPTYRTEIRQEITRERKEVLFQTICPPDQTVDFVQSLQRALKTRGYYLGPITGALDPATNAAIRAFQRVSGHDSTLIDIATARALGLTVLSQEQLDRG